MQHSRRKRDLTPVVDIALCIKRSIVELAGEIIAVLHIQMTQPKDLDVTVKVADTSTGTASSQCANQRRLCASQLADLQCAGVIQSALLTQQQSSPDREGTAVINDLIAAGYSLGMTEKGLAVYKY